VSRSIPPEWRDVTPGHRGRFAGFDVLKEADRWDEATAEAVLDRLDDSSPCTFFTPSEQAAAGALFDLLLDQHLEPRVPVLRLVDHRLARGETDGWAFDDLPEDGEAWRRTLAALDEDARDRFGERFALLAGDRQRQLVQAVQDADEWHGWSADHIWSLWTRYACSAFYAHPWAWNEIGFGGPAYPRGYQALGIGKLEHWEVADGRVRATRGDGGR
jgi:hypothetical protein